tara:strand:+ start:305 stop:541 length:237 start_codon:yes stop_codon:yes gene_type:complete
MLSRSDALCVGGIAGGFFVTGVGLSAVRLMVKNYDKEKNKWWLDPQLVVTSACTAVAAVLTTRLSYGVVKGLTQYSQK